MIKLVAMNDLKLILKSPFEVIKACRDRGQIVFGQQPNLPEICDYHSAKKNHGICEIRRVKIEKTKSEGLGISITGGRVERFFYF